MIRRCAVGVLLLATIATACAGSSSTVPETTVAASTTPPTLPVYDDDRTDLTPGPAPTVIDDELLARVGASAVRFSGEGCRRSQIGSGFVVGQDLIMTNAHVVAGVEELAMQLPGNDEVADIEEVAVVTGTVVSFDPSADIAMIEAPTGDIKPLDLGADAELDEEGLILGFGGAGAAGVLDPDPYRINRRIVATGENIYREEGENRRASYLIASEIEPGDSGGALVGADGTVVGMAFASSRRGEGAYALRATVLAEHLANPVVDGDPTRCAEG